MFGAADEDLIGAPGREEEVGGREGVEPARVAVAHRHVERAEILPDAHVAAGAVGDRVREFRRVDVPGVFELRDAIELGDGLEAAVRVGAHDAHALGRAVDVRAVLLEARVVHREATGDDEQLREAIERAQPLVAEVLGGIEPRHLDGGGVLVLARVERLELRTRRAREQDRRAHRFEERLAPRARARDDAEPGDDFRGHGETPLRLPVP